MTLLLWRVIEIIWRLIAPTQDLPCFFSGEGLYPVLQNRPLRQNMAVILDKDEIVCNDYGSYKDKSNIR